MLITKICAAELSKKIVSAAEILKKDPYNEEANYAMAYDHFQNKDYEKAITHLKKIEGAPEIYKSNHLRINLLLFYCHHRMGHPELSTALFKEKKIDLDADILTIALKDISFPIYDKFNNAFEETIIDKYLTLKISAVNKEIEKKNEDLFRDIDENFAIVNELRGIKPPEKKQENQEEEIDELKLMGYCGRLRAFIESKSHRLIIHTIHIMYKKIPKLMQDFAIEGCVLVSFNNDEFQFTLGSAYYNLNNHRKAKEHLLKAAQINPYSEETKNLLRQVKAKQSYLN